MKSLVVAAAAALLYLTPAGSASAAPLNPTPAIGAETADVMLAGHRHGHRHWKRHRHHHHWHHRHHHRHGWHHHHHRRHYHHAPGVYLRF